MALRLWGKPPAGDDEPEDPENYDDVEDLHEDMGDLGVKVQDLQ